MTLHTTACPRNCYSTCTMTVEVEDGRLRRVLPHAGNRATSGGPCLKGLAYVERVASPQRILHPLRRRPDGSFERISWDQALDEIASRLQRVRAEDGPQAVLYYSASGTKGLLNRVGTAFWRLYGGYTGTYGDLCWPAGLEATRLTLGANTHNAPWDLANARLIVLWGKNAAETNIHQMPFVEASLQAGGRLVVVDPRRTETAERAELLVQPRPGTDGALALAIAHVLFRDGLVDQPFTDAHVLGHEEYRERVADLTPDWAETITGVPARAIERLAALMGSVQPMTVAAGFGMQRYANSGQTMRALLALVALTGNLGRRGAGWQFANLQTAVFDEVQDPVAFYPPERPDGVARIAVSTARLGAGMLALRDPPLRMAWVERGNPIPQNPETPTVLRAFRALDFRVVVEQFLTDTAQEADIVLPAKTLFEQTDVIGAYWHPYIQLRPKVLEPPGEVKPESEVYRLLAERLGVPAAAVDAELPGIGEEAVREWLTGKLAPFPELSLERLEQGPVLAPGHQEVAFEDLRFPTPSGKIELRSEEAARRWGVDALPGWSEPVEAGQQGGRHPLCLMTPNTKNRIHSQFGNLDMIRANDPAPVLRLSPVDALPRAIRDGDRVRVFNDRGSLELPCTLDFGILAGCVCLTNGWWIGDDGAVNLLSAGRETDMGHGAAFHENRVQVEPSRG
ncbi:MAG TPA: molybdopterin-dependent oxidoreductase [Longimicrobiales bacterium]|nr:molybdopterin-dependent oxidoreductase [Longimicrobiales bacterium]